MNSTKINANILSLINFCVMFNEHSKILPDYELIKETCLDNDSSKKEIIKCFNECKSFNINDDCIIFYFDISEDEKKAYFNKAREDLEIRIKILHKHYINDNYKSSIIDYCKLKQLNWLLDRLNQL